jgi:hypothetical protein
MLKIKDDVPLIDLIDIGFESKRTLKGSLRYCKSYGNYNVMIRDKGRQVFVYNPTEKSLSYNLPLFCIYIRDLVQKGYVEEIK